ncbi:endolytic transglycosylase MltG, partial [Neobacillus drentensis]|uniref:endolytic transglycosylase MltG n=1 Tax=Neobacillus drentensis TaxID=220684 RepID=UPI003001D5A5
DIPMGSSVTGIAETLESKGIIKSAKVFKYYVKLKNEAGFMAGEYQLSPSMDVPEIVSRLKTGKVLAQASFKITIPEGRQLKEIAAIMAKATKQNENDVFIKLNDKEFIKTLMAKYPDILTEEILNSSVKYPLEGYLYPATYPFYKKNPSVEEMVAAMLTKTRTVLSGYAEKSEKKKLSVHQLLTMASLVEEEATEKADRKTIASVFYNRIKKGMMLQTDPTVLYARGKHKARVLYKDLEVDSPYNTYQNTGLPPGPIASAGKSSIEASLEPADTDFYYFLATADGDVIFTKTLEEHNKEKAKHITSKK